ncbi:MAG: glycine--tRNA ligase subunit beta [Roseomonas sp.]|nr:glycine--tRNA ligase subunit beta [Roseomonas sp.]MCA3327060.1 glycine--tRNA ligase subunit beta [Roseomonas sp.]MCA3330973.1 glycine--tRNA ligase subunit beta [Roseomonas sp.]MCA3334057.1 glycine--tRNA ligase subunit beta [Roseomonas sp.]MCA3346078.1 glycine--tRNA ligase subunit beta [Roseomonas sp.]
MTEFAELLIELFSEEIPARMQEAAADRFCDSMRNFLGKSISPPRHEYRAFGPRRITYRAEIRTEIPSREDEKRGPRLDAPDEPLLAFLTSQLPRAENPMAWAKEGLVTLKSGGVFDVGGPSQLRFEASQAGKATHVFMRRTLTGEAPASILARELPLLIRAFPWPKSMRWGGTSSMVWVRPLKRILCVLDGAVVPFTLAQGGDDGHGLVSGDLTEGHRIMSPGAFGVRDFAEYKAELAERQVVLEAEDRARMIRDGITALAAAEGLDVVPDEALIAEVAGLVEWPVPLLGRIDDAFMDLPPEVMRTTMRVNQRYFALRKRDGTAAPRFALVANIAAPDGGAAIVAGNERVLRARLADARFFWDLDRKQKLESFLPKLDSVVFHAKLGTQGQRVARLENLAGLIAEKLGADATLARRAARLAKADLASGMVGEFPELQGVMGRYYALGQHEDARVAEAIAAHYRPAGAGDAVPTEGVAIAVALADKIDQLVGFFAVGEKPTGSGDPFALRRAALGIIRIIRENGLRLPLADLMGEAFFLYRRPSSGEYYTPPGLVAKIVRATDSQAPSDGEGTFMVAAFEAGLLDFLVERLRVQLRGEGARHDVATAVFGATPDDDLNRLLSRAEAVRGFVESEAGANLLAAHRRAINILRIEEKRDGHAFDTGYEAHLLKLPEEAALAAALEEAGTRIRLDIEAEDFERAMEAMAALRAPVDGFFEKVIVNDPAPELRRNRLRLLARLRAAMDTVADFSKIEA